MKNLKQELLRGELIEFETENDLIFTWFSTTTQRFIIELNGLSIFGVKTFSVFEKKLNTLLK